MSSQATATPMMGDQTNHNHLNHLQFADRDPLRLSIPQAEPANFSYTTTTSPPETSETINSHPAPTEDPDHSKSLQQLLARLKEVSEKQREQSENAPATQQVLEHHTPEAPSASPLDSSNPSSRPSTARLIDDAETAGLSDHNLRALQSLMLGLGQPDATNMNMAQNMQGLGIQDDAAHADLLAAFAMHSQRIAGQTPAENAPGQLAPQGDVVDLLQDATQELGDPTTDHLQKAHDAGQIEAFAKIDFADGYFYMTTASLELGRDELAFKSAQEKARKQEEKRQRSQPSSSSGNASNKMVRRAVGSQVHGSVVSESGGFCGIDPKAAEEEEAKDADPSRSHSSQLSDSSVVRMADLELNPPPRFDYKTRMEEAMEADNEKPAPVTADHLPKPDSNPLIPIHPVTDNGVTRLDVQAEIEAHKSISRRHARIAWNDTQQCFVLEVLGRNGVFLNHAYMQRGQSAPLNHNSLIEISGIQMHFRLPPSQADSSDESANEEEESSPNRVNKQSTTPTSDDDEEAEASTSVRRREGAKTLLTSAATGRTEPITLPPRVGPDGQPLPPRRRGPGRPPKDGIMSNRERRELAKAQKAAAAKEANGGVTPPPSGRAGASRPSVADAQPDSAKGEKRKYTKRKREDGEEDGDVMPSVEGEQEQEQLKTKPGKKPRTSKSPSPSYPTLSELSPGALAKPQHNYARMIYDALIAVYPKALPLRYIYQALKLKYPYFVHVVETGGWQSSVRHNLNSETNKLFHRGPKEGKGHMWSAIPGKFTESKEDITKKRKAQDAAQAEAKVRAAQKNQYPYGAHQNWPQQPMQPFRPPPGLQPNGQPFPAYYGPNGQYGPPPNGMQWPQAPPRGAIRPSQPLLQPNQNSAARPGSLSGPLGPWNAGAGANGATPPNLGPNGGGAGQSNGIQQNLAHPLAGQHINRPGSASSMPPAAPVPNVPASSSLPSNMPCSLQGIQAIQAFKTRLMQSTDAERQPVTNAIFDSARGRVMHGWPASTMPEGERDLPQEADMIEMLEHIVKQFANPNYIKPKGKDHDAPGNAQG